MPARANWRLPDLIDRQHKVAPLIVTAMMGAADLRWADRLRRDHYPVERNRVPAHLTLFRHLPPSCETELRALLAAMARGPKPSAMIEGLVALGDAVAIGVRSPGLLEMRAEMARRLEGLLMPLDQAEPRLHVTIRNKVAADVARTTLAALRKRIAPRPLEIAGLECWRYAEGPWKLAGRWPFRG